MTPIPVVVGAAARLIPGVRLALARPRERRAPVSRGNSTSAPTVFELATESTALRRIEYTAKTAASRAIHAAAETYRILRFRREAAEVRTSIACGFWIGGGIGSVARTVSAASAGAFTARACRATSAA